MPAFDDIANLRTPVIKVGVCLLRQAPEKRMINGISKDGSNLELRSASVDHSCTDFQRRVISPRSPDFVGDQKSFPHSFRMALFRALAVTGFSTYADMKQLQCWMHFKWYNQLRFLFTCHHDAYNCFHSGLTVSLPIGFDVL